MIKQISRFLFFIDSYKEYKDPCRKVEYPGKVPRFEIKDNRVCFSNSSSEDEYFKTLEGADPKTFKEEGCYEIDKNYIYYYFGKTDIDRESFRSLGYCYAKDKNYIYYGKSKVDKADVNSFEALRFDYAKDKDSVYKSSEILDRDSNTFKILTQEYSKDKNGAYYNDKKIVDADSDTFGVIIHSYAKDKNSCYNYDKKVDMSTCEYILSNKN